MNADSLTLVLLCTWVRNLQCFLPTIAGSDASYELIFCHFPDSRCVCLVSMFIILCCALHWKEIGDCCRCLHFVWVPLHADGLGQRGASCLSPSGEEEWTVQSWRLTICALQLFVCDICKLQELLFKALIAVYSAVSARLSERPSDLDLSEGINLEEEMRGRPSASVHLSPCVH